MKNQILYIQGICNIYKLKKISYKHFEANFDGE